VAQLVVVDSDSLLLHQHYSHFWPRIDACIWHHLSFLHCQPHHSQNLFEFLSGLFMRGLLSSLPFWLLSFYQYCYHFQLALVLVKDK
jgi:hypothetical protein